MDLESELAFRENILFILEHELGFWLFSVLLFVLFCLYKAVLSVFEGLGRSGWSQSPCITQRIDNLQHSTLLLALPCWGWQEYLPPGLSFLFILCVGVSACMCVHVVCAVGAGRRPWCACGSQDNLELILPLGPGSESPHIWWGAPLAPNWAIHQPSAFSWILCMWVWVPSGARRNLGSSGAGVNKRLWATQCRCWSRPSVLQEQCTLS